MNLEEVINVADFERAAAGKLDAGPAGYFFGGACDEVTLEESVVAWRRRRLRPRVLAGCGEWGPRTTVLGSEVSSPVLVAPVAYQRLVDEGAEAAMFAGGCNCRHRDVPLDPRHHPAR